MPARASSEIRSVADALDRVQATAYALATEQAMLRRHTTDSMANLGRRNQSLLRRQLGFISELEREETDPVGLANLFELDHLAARMRRNAESLLVLAGVSTPRQWSAAMPSPRSSSRDGGGRGVPPGDDATHRRRTTRRLGAHQRGAHARRTDRERPAAVLTPDSTVEIEGAQLPQGYLIAIIDQGIGMSADDLSVANARLRSESEFLSEPARFLGHSVVGHLARQMDIDVHLVPSPVTGITARVIMPAKRHGRVGGAGVAAPLHRPRGSAVSSTSNPPR